MLKRITLKLVLAFLLAAVCMFTLLNVFGMRRLERDLLKDKRDLLTKEAKLIADDYGEKYYRSAMTLSDLKKQLRSIDAFLDIRIILTNVQGVIVADTRSEDRVMLDSGIDGFPSGLHYENIIIPILSDKEQMVVAEPVYFEYDLRGYICLFITMDQVYTDAVYYMNLMNRSLLIFTACLLLIFIWVYFFSIRPAEQLKKTVVEYARGNYEYESKRKLPDEYREIGEAVNFIAREVENLEDYRKKFVANISHDFRSPLTSIKGYVEAIKDGTIPREAQDRYLDIILFETERLTKLTTDLLILNSMDNHRAELDISVFDINTMIKRTAASFEGSCTKKRITMDLIFCAEEVFVSADHSRIQQVLYNLIDNAIKFSNTESVISVSVEEKGSKVFTSVKDYGIGIPKDSIKRIWERFYKTDLSRGKDKRGTGLGLSITKDIINAHNENINVISTEGVGTEFIFSLPRAEL